MIEQNLILVLVMLPFLGAVITATLPVNAHNAAAWISALVLAAGLALMAVFHAPVAEGRILRGVVQWVPALQLNLSCDWVKVPIDATRRAEIEQALADKADTAVHYQLRGNVRISEPARDYDIFFEAGSARCRANPASSADPGSAPSSESRWRIP